jgi:hypothetical protein
MKPMNRISLAILLGALAIGNAACNNSLGGFSGSVGNTPPTTPETSYRIFGNVGMPFTALVSDARSSWVVHGSAPETIVILNVVLPSRLAVTKLVSDNSLMSVEVITGSSVVNLASTVDPYGTASVQQGGSLAVIAPQANPDVEIAVTGPTNETFDGLIQDSSVAYTIGDTAPSVYLFDSPDGKVTAQLFQITTVGGLVVNVTLNGVVTATSQGAKVVISSP